MSKNMKEFKTQLIDDVLDIVYMDNITMSSELKQKIRNYSNLDSNSNFKRYMIFKQIRRAVIDKQPNGSTGLTDLLLLEIKCLIDYEKFNLK